MVKAFAKGDIMLTRLLSEIINLFDLFFSLIFAEYDFDCL